MTDNAVLKSLGLPENFQPQTSFRVWGVDLGTTNSTVTEIVWSPHTQPLKPPKARCLELDQLTNEGVFTSPLVPSVLAVLPSGAMCG